jgi:ABC-type branched-subunit amino acid transport system ATPase component/ABC-type branched-subunit amino acid transport system permease subunit
MRRGRDLLIFAGVLVAAAVLLPLWLNGPDLDRTALSLTIAGPAAGAALSLAVGRPNLAIGALAGVGAYLSGALAIRGIDVPLAVLLAVVACAGVGALLALATARLDVVGLLASTLLLSVGLAALTQALPQQSGGQAGLGPLPALGTSLPGDRVLNLTPTGDLHAALAAALAVTVLTALLLSGGIGARWRAVGSDRSRAAGSGLRPLRAEVTVLALAGALAGAGGALGAHISAVATPDLFAADVVALPLLAALLAGRGSALGAVIAGVATGLVGSLVLPDLGWRGPPSATALALALLAVAVVASLLPGSPPVRREVREEIDAEAPWPFSDDGFAGAPLAVEGLDVRAGPLTLVRSFSMAVPAGQIHGLVGPNGAGKSSLLAALADTPSPHVRFEGGGVIVLQPQSGGGFPACSVDETLLLAARAGGREAAEARRVAAAWRGRLGLDASGSTLCAELSAGRRRLIDLARVLLRRPAVLLCDEPLAGLDPAARATAVSLLRAAGAAGLTIVLAEHDRAAVAALASGTTELRRQEQEQVYDTAADPVT